MAVCTFGETGLFHLRWYVAKRYKELIESENTAFQTFGDTSKAVLTKKFVELKAYIRKEEKSQINDLSFHLKNLKVKKKGKQK